jgi:hypothetical protein
MREIKRPTWMVIKAGLFCVLGISASVLLYQGSPTATTLVLLALAVWSFCRLYYFGFYVVEHYIDPSYRFSGLFSVAQYLIATKLRKEKSGGPA